MPLSIWRFGFNDDKGLCRAMDGPLDFELEDSFPKPPLLAKKRRNVIGLDQLLTDHNAEKNKSERESKRRQKAKKKYGEDEDFDTREARLSTIVDDCHKKIQGIADEEDNSVWGLRVFGDQKGFPSMSFPELGNCMLLQSFMNNKLNSVVDLKAQTAEPFLEGFLINGWLTKLIFMHGQLENNIATWAFNLMLYSSKEELRMSACEFWCAVLLSDKVDNVLPIKMDWCSGYSDLKSALQNYGYLSTFQSSSDSEDNDNDYHGPPQNIRAWIKFTAACCKVRDKQSIFLTSEVEELLEVIICMLLDRRLQGLLMLLYECMRCAINYFTDIEWNTSCEKVAKSLAHRVSCDMNCLRIVECITGIDTRSKQLRQLVSYQILLSCFGDEATNEEEILRSLVSINVKDRNCNLFKMNIYLVLTENWLLYNQLLEEKPLLHEMLGGCLRNISRQIFSNDLRAHAAKVRSRALYMKLRIGH